VATAPRDRVDGLPRKDPWGTFATGARRIEAPRKTGNRRLGELRRNPVTGRWTVVAPERAVRPFDVPTPVRTTRPLLDPDCPFCPGNESELPRIVWELACDEDPGWVVRAVPNRYPALAMGGAQQPRAAEGIQEVLIETPRHDLDPSGMSAAELSSVIAGYHSRYLALSARLEDAHLVLFRNHGRHAGTSLVHAHAQLYASRTPVPDITRRERRARAYHHKTGVCLICSLDELEPHADARTVAENGSFRAIVPWAPATTLEVWIIPRDHQASFAEASAEQQGDLADMLGTILARYRARAGDPSYNGIWHSARLTDAGAPHLHWFVQLRPRLARSAGFELASGVDIAPSDPRQDAALLR